MSRIRTVKPELFKHEELFDAEIASNLPLRLAFIGLFTCCDRAGRFRWQPRRLKLDLMPYDDVDLAKILDALFNYGFIKKYEHHGKWYGSIPSWSKHQHINHREIDSDLPAPPDSMAAPLVAAQQVPTGGLAKPDLSEPASVKEPHEPSMQIVDVLVKNDLAVAKGYNTEAATINIFQYWKDAMQHPDAKLDHKRKGLISKALNFGYSVEQLCQAINGCKLTPYNMGDNDRSQRYDGLHIILRDADQIDRFIQNYHNPPYQIRKVDQQIQGNIAAMQRWINKKMQEVDPDEERSRFS